MSFVIIFTAVSIVVSSLLIPLIIKFCKIFSLYDATNARKIHSGSIPRLGGIAIAAAFTSSVTACFILDTKLSMTNSVPIIVAGLLIFIFGIIDDIIEMRAIFKLIVQTAASTIVVANGFQFKQLFGWILPTPISFIFTIIWIIGIINAYNLIDGLDGLCGMLTISTLLTIAVILIPSYAEGAAICFILSAAIMGFLFFNLPLPNAKIFMGDGGSQFLGFMIATIPLYHSTRNLDFEFNKFLLMLVLVSFPMIDTIAAIWRRLRDHRPIMSPDKFHLHHKLLNLGLSKRQVLYFIMGIQFIICSISYISISIKNKFSTLLLAIAYFAMLGFFTIIHYSNRAVLRK